MRALNLIAMACAAIVANLAHAVCVPNHYAIEVKVAGETLAAVNNYWTSVEPKVGGKCVRRGTYRIYCMYELQGGQAPGAVELGVLIDTLEKQTPTSVDKQFGAAWLTRVKSLMTCKPGAGGGCVTVPCTGGTMSVPNCKPCGP